MSVLEPVQESTGTSPVFTACHKVISLVYSLFQYIIRDGILLKRKKKCILKCRLLKSSDELSIEANSVDPEQTAPIGAV